MGVRLVKQRTFQEVKVPVIVVGCKLDLRDEQYPMSLEQVMAPIMQQYREIETCIECSAANLVQIDLLAEISQSPRILSEVDAALKAKKMKTDVDEYLKVHNLPPTCKCLSILVLVEKIKRLDEEHEALVETASVLVTTVKVPVIVVGCKLDLRDEQYPMSLEQVMAPIMQQYREIETCIECSATNLVQIDLLAEISQSPRILSEVNAALKAKQMKTDVDEYLKTRPQGTSFLSDLKQKLLLSPSEAARAGT
ncbi:transcription regulator [Artemisia annua]|uniref:Transcription regulator n=1 Tax=Artemisia annua TaxID=35608 RepID=A0A2U1KRL7_ARTAN|nr:transcription regulator [Artemisia annua]